jgi:hypothetical protein
VSTSQSHAFYRDVARTRQVWTVRDAGGYPAPKNSRGVRAQPFWSSRSRAEGIIKSVAAYHGFTPVEVSWEAFRDRWLPDLEREGFEVGVNWSGREASGYDVPPAEVREAIEWQIANVVAAS